ncbi:hypothetical protein [Helicobacter cinaedi]|nr:hypothetical protein [Helicobacter cinaedi]
MSVNLLRAFVGVCGVGLLITTQGKSLRPRLDNPQNHRKIFNA